VLCGERAARRSLIGRNLKYVLEATLLGARGPHVRLKHGFARRHQDIPTSPDGPPREFHRCLVARARTIETQAIRGPVGQGGDAVSVASFVAAQRTEHGVPHAFCCRVLGISESWFYKWRDRPPTPRQRRRTHLVTAIRARFDASDGTYGSPRVVEDLWEAGWRVSENTVAKLMAEEGLVARPKRRHRTGLTRSDRQARRAPDLVQREFSAPAPNVKWCGDFKQIDTDEGPIFLGSVEDLYSRRLLGFAMSECYPTAELAQAAIHMAVAVRGGDVAGVIFHTDQGTQPRLNGSSQHCRFRQSVEDGRVLRRVSSIRVSCVVGC
jgi:HTH-like domain/Integrase core domain